MSGSILWLTGLPGSGKTTLAYELCHTLHQEHGLHSIILDGDALRAGLSADLDHSINSRLEQARRAIHIANLISDQNTIAIVALVSPYRRHRDQVRVWAGRHRFVEVYVNTPVAVCRARQPDKYGAADAGRLLAFTGVTATYEPPLEPEVAVCPDLETVTACYDRILRHLGL